MSFHTSYKTRSATQTIMIHCMTSQFTGLSGAVVGVEQFLENNPIKLKYLLN